MKNAYLNDIQIHGNEGNPLGMYLKSEIQGLDTPSMRLPTNERPNVDGAFVPNQLYGGRAISLQGRVSGDGDMLTYRARRRIFLNATRISRPGSVLAPITFKFKTMDDLELQTDVYVQKRRLPELLMSGGSWTLDLFAPDIRLLSQELHTEQINIFQGGGMPIPMPIPMGMATGGSVESVITNVGDYGSQPLITIRGPIEDPTISNQTTGESMSIDYTLTSSDERIEIDVRTHTMLYYATDASSGVNIRNKFSGDWFELEGMDDNNVLGENTIKLVVADTSDTGYILIRWRDAWLGI